MYIYAHINKETLQFIREKKIVSFDYVNRITKLSKSKILEWEDLSSSKFPTIKQAKTIAKCYRIPFAGLYMNSDDINAKHLPQMRNLRTLPDASIDNSALNLAIADILNARELLIESRATLKENIPQFTLSVDASVDDVVKWARVIREKLYINTDVQYRCQSSRQFYLYVRDCVEATGIFVHCFTGIDVEVARGLAIYDEKMPIIGLNNNDRYPGKTFSTIHELVHLIKRSSAICNEMFDSFASHNEEIFCNAVAGEVLVPKANLIKQLGSYTAAEIDLHIIEALSKKFSVSKEVITRRLLDCEKISQTQYNSTMSTIKLLFDSERETAKEQRRLTGHGIPRNISREAVDQTSGALCRTFYHGYIAAGKAAWKKPSLRCISRASLCAVWRISQKRCGVARYHLPPLAS